MQELEKKHIKKFQKNIAEGNRVKRALTELPIVFLVLYQKRLNGHSVFFYFFVIKKFFLRNISVNINFDVNLVLTENSLWIKEITF